MILQIDHVAISSKNFENDLKLMKSIGYNLDFVERDINNLIIKKKLMKNFTNDQSLALFRNGFSLGIEILDHGTTNPKSSYITPIFEKMPYKLVKKFEDDQIRYISKNSNSTFQFNKLLIKSNDLKKSKEFWKNFGFSIIHDDPPVLEFKSMFSNFPCQIHFKEENDHPYFLDDNGFSCIAFITNSIKRERGLLKSKKIEVTKIESLAINNKNLSVFFATGPSGELVEIVEVKID